MLQNLKLLYRLLLIAALPMAAVAYFATIDISRLIERRHSGSVVAELVSVSTVIGDLIHELQRERGLSAGYTSSKGAKFGGQIPGQRARTDKALAAMNQSLDASAKTIAQSPLADGLGRLREKFGHLAKTRQEIDALQLSVPEIAKRYTEKVDFALETLDELSSIGRSGDASRERSAYLLLLHAKEYAGLERAMGAAGFTAGDFRSPIYRKFAAYGARQIDVFKKVREFASQSDIAALDKVNAGAANRMVTQYREAADKSISPNTPLEGFPDAWWKATTARIDQLKQVEDAMAQEIVAGARGDLGAATSELYRALAIFLGIVVVMVAAIWLVTRSILNPVRAVIGTMDDMSQGHLQGETGLPQGNTELGKLGDSVRAFRRQLAGVEAARAEQERQKEAQTALIADSIGAGLKALSTGNLTHRVTANLDGPLAVLKTDFNAAITSLENLIGAAVASIASIRSGSSEIAQASEDLAHRTERSAASLEETTAAISNLTEGLNATSSAARETLEGAGAAGRVVAEGRQVAGEAANSMRGVAESAKGIDDVIEGLDKIAFQTRVLAMNAAVEAGRAGEAGRGFAVVADLVSALAMRAEEEAKNARSQLTMTQAEIERAVGAVGRVDSTLDAILSSMGTVQTLVERIAGANEQQATVISQISAAMQDMDVSTQKNAAMVEQTSAAARNLMGEARGLAGHTDAFETRTESARRGAMPAKQDGALHLAA